MLIRPIKKNAPDKKISIRQFPSPEHPYIAFPSKNLTVLDISRFTFCKVDYRSIRVESVYNKYFNLCYFPCQYTQDCFFRLNRHLFIVGALTSSTLNPDISGLETGIYVDR